MMNASPEENVSESAVLDAPIEPIKPIDPIAPTAPAESAGVPVGNVVTGTLPSQGTIPAMSAMPADTAAAGETNAPSPAEGAQTSAATAVLPNANDGVQGSAAKPTKSLKKKLIMGGAAAAGVAIVVVGVAGFTFAKADFAHAFMGNKKYSTALMGQQIEKVLETPVLSAGMASVNAGSDTDGVTGSVVSALSQLKTSIPESGAQLEISVDADLSDETIEELANDADCDTEQVKKIVEAVKALKLSGGVQFSENGIAATAAASEGGSELMKVNVLYDDETEAYYVSVPGVSDECLMFADEKAVIDMEALNKGDQGDLVKEMVTDVLAKYKDCLRDAEITYGRAEFSIGDVEFKGKMSSVVFEDDKLADMISDVSDEFLDSEFADSLGDVSEIERMVNSLVKGVENCDSAKLTIENFVTSGNALSGMRMELEGKKNGEKEKHELAYLDTKDGIAFSLESYGEKVLELYETKENKSSGKYTVKLSVGGESGKITVDYENKSEKKMFGKNVTLGDFTMKFSGDVYNTEDMPFDKLTVNIADEDGKLGYSIGAKKGDDSASFKLALSEGIPEQIDAETMKISAAYDANSDTDKAEVNGYYTKLLEYMAAQTKDSEFFNSVPVYDSTLADYLQATAERALRERGLVENYAAYNKRTVSDANKAATQICYAVRNINFNTASGAAKVKLYYNNDGTLSILDSAGMSNLENEIHEKLGGLGYKNAYVEIAVWSGRGPVCGVNVVMTDDSGNIPDDLPDAYNFLDRQYKWGTEEDVNFVGSFAVGAYPKLANGEGGETKAADEKLAALVKTYSADAEKAAKAMSEYTGLTFTEGKTCYLAFTIKDGEWRYDTYGGARTSGNSADVAAYLTENVGAVGARNVCFYYEGSKLVGAIASDNSYYYYSFAADDFKRGSTEIWGYMDGIAGGDVVGTYPNLTKLTSVPQEYFDEMVGTWVSGDETVTITADDLKNITDFSFSRSGASITNIYIQTVNKDVGNFFFYPNNGEPYINSGFYKFTKQ